MINKYHEGILDLAFDELGPSLKEYRGKLYYNGSKIGMPGVVRLMNRVRLEKGLNAIGYPGVNL